MTHRTTTRQPPDQDQPPRTARSSKQNARWIALAVLGGVVLLLGRPLLGLAGIGAWQIDGPSMEPTFPPGSRVYALPGTPARGDVVIVESPADGVTIVKRVIAIGGDRIALEDGVILLNGERIERRDVGLASDATSRCFEERLGAVTFRTIEDADSLPESMPELLVPTGELFVMGDHRDRSNDSRNPRVGTIDSAHVLGRVAGQYGAGEGVVCSDVE